MTDLTSPHGLDPELLRHIDSVCLEFEREWRGGRRPRAEESLPRVEAGAVPELLRELLLVELHYRRKQGEMPTLDEYRARFPDYANLIAGLFTVPAAISTITHTNMGLDGAVESARGERLLPVVPGFEILVELGSGGMGVVYKARHLSLNRLVALKVVLGGALAGSERLSRFAKEAEATARLEHPHAVRIHDYGDAAGMPFLALEYVSGGSLAQKLARDGRLAPREAVELVRKLATAVAAAHAKEIVHRDLKPANVLLTESGEPKVADFGLAKLIDTADGQTVTGSVHGTPAYMAPEQARGDTKAIGPAADVYALGVILFEMLTGQVPFADSSTIALLKKVDRQPPPSPRSLNRIVSRDLEAICMRCLEKRPADRYPSAAAFTEDLTNYLENKPLKHARSVGSLGRLWRWCRRNPVTTGLGAAAVLLVFAAAMFLTRDDSLSRVKRAGKLVVGIDPNGAPYSIKREGKPAGIDVELAKAIASRLDVTADFVELYWNWPGLVGQLDEQKIDVLISCVSISEERKREVSFVEYARDPFVFATRHDAPILKRADLRGKVLIAQQGTLAEGIALRLQQDEGDIIVSAPVTLPETFDAVRAEKGRVVLEHQRIAEYYARQPGLPLKIFPATDIDPTLADQRIGIALRRESRELRKAIEKAVEEMEADGSLKAILDP